MRILYCVVVVVIAAAETHGDGHRFRSAHWVCADQGIASSRAKFENCPWPSLLEGHREAIRLLEAPRVLQGRQLLGGGSGECASPSHAAGNVGAILHATELPVEIDEQALTLGTAIEAPILQDKTRFDVDGKYAGVEVAVSWLPKVKKSKLGSDACDGNDACDAWAASLEVVGIGRFELSEVVLRYTNNNLENLFCQPGQKYRLAILVETKVGSEAWAVHQSTPEFGSTQFRCENNERGWDGSTPCSFAVYPPATADRVRLKMSCLAKTTLDVANMHNINSQTINGQEPLILQLQLMTTKTTFQWDSEIKQALQASLVLPLNCTAVLDNCAVQGKFDAWFDAWVIPENGRFQSDPDPELDAEDIIPLSGAPWKIRASKKVYTADESTVEKRMLCVQPQDHGEVCCVTKGLQLDDNAQEANIATGKARLQNF